MRKNKRQIMLFCGLAFICVAWGFRGINLLDEKDLLMRDKKSEIFREKPDSGDIRMAQSDMLVPTDDIEKEMNSVKSPSMESITKNARLKEQRDRLAKHLGTEDIYSLTSPELWKKIRDFILEHWKELNINGYLSLPLTIRYNFCVYIIMMIPAEIAFPFPAFYKYLIPKKTYKIQLINDFLMELDNFLKFVKAESKNQFLISFYVGKNVDLKEDIDFLLEIPKLISTDPIKILRWFLRFEFKSDGYKKLE